MSKINLLPSGHFEVTLNDGSIVKGRYSAKALKMLAGIYGYNFSQTWNLISGQNSTVSTYLELVMCAIKSEGGECDEFKVLEIFEDLGGFTGEETQALLSHFIEGFVPKKKVEQNGLSHGVNA